MDIVVFGNLIVSLLKACDAYNVIITLFGKPAFSKIFKKENTCNIIILLFSLSPLLFYQ